MVDPLFQNAASDSDELPTSDAFTISRHGEVTVIIASPLVDQMESSLLEGASAILLDALKRDSCPQIVVDLGRLHYFGSAFLALLIRCWKLATLRGGSMVLARVSDRAKDLLHITSLDMVWPFYPSVHEAVAALESD